MALKTPTEKKLQRVIERSEMLVNTASEETLASLRRAVGNFSVRANEILRDVLAGKGDRARLDEVLDISEQLNQALIDAGLDDTVDLFRRRFKAIEKAAVDYYGEFGIPKTRAGLDVDTLNAFAALQEKQFLNLADERLVQPLADAIIQGVAGRQPRDTILTSVSELTKDLGITTRAGKEFTDRQMETLVNDGFRRHLREAKRQKAEALGMQVVWFQGPLDEKTSEQCEFLLTEARHGAPGFWYVDEFTEDLHPKLESPPITGGGHPDCRHTMSIVPLSFAVTKGFEVDPEDVEAENEEIEDAA